MSNAILQYAKDNYKKMFRQPGGQLKYTFIAPGSYYANQLWDWDSWLTDIALHQIAEENFSEYAYGCIRNFLEHMDAYDRIPMMIAPDKQLPLELTLDANGHKPCLVQHAAFLTQQNGGDATWIEPWFPRLKAFVDGYIRHHRHECGLYFWIDDCGLGVDNDPCTFYRPLRSSASIFLNCLMYKELEALVYIGKILGEDVSSYEEEAANLKTAVREQCYDEKDGMYYSVDLNLLPVDPNSFLHKGAPRHWQGLIQRIGVWSGFMAMWAGIATPEQAERMVKENLLNEKAFWAPYGVRSLSKYEKMYAIRNSGNPSCWLGPIWGIANYMVFRSLVKYGYTEEARILAQKTVDLFNKDIAETGEIHEYYDPESGAPIRNPGFQSWNLLSVNMLAWLQGEKTVEEF